MSREPHPSAANPASRSVGAEELKRVLGELDDSKIVEILALNPDVTDLEQAAICLAGDDDVLERVSHAASPTARRIVDILSANEDGEEEHRSS